MEPTQYLIDTGIVIDYLGEKLPPAGMAFIDNVMNAIPNVSLVSKIDVLALNVPEEHAQVLHNFMNDAIVLDLSPNVVKNCIIICKTHKVSMPQAMIAATAITYNYTMITNNERDYINIKGLRMINPYSL